MKALSIKQIDEESPEIDEDDIGEDIASPGNADVENQKVTRKNSKGTPAPAPTANDFQLTHSSPTRVSVLFSIF